MSTLPDLAPDALFARVAGILEQARARAVPAVQNEMALAYWYFGREIVTELQQGAARAGYGDALQSGFAAQLTRRFGRGYYETSLKYFRQLYTTYADRVPEIRHEARDESAPALPPQSPTGDHGRTLLAARFSDDQPCLGIFDDRQSITALHRCFGESRRRRPLICYDSSETPPVARMSFEETRHPASGPLSCRPIPTLAWANQTHQSPRRRALRQSRASLLLDTKRLRELGRVRMIIAFRTRALRDLSHNEARAERMFGKSIASKLRQRLAELRAADAIEDLVVGNPTALPGDGPPQMSLDLGGDHTIIFCPNHPASKRRGSPESPWSGVRRVKIVQIGGAP